MLMPKRVKRRKQFRGSMAGKALRGNTISNGEYGLVSTEPCWIKSNQIEAARVAMTRYIKRGGKVWIKIFPDKPVTAKPAETRMGSGKGALEYWVAVVKPGRVLFEIAGVPEEDVYKRQGPKEGEATTQNLTKINGKTYLFNDRGNPVYGLQKVRIGSTSEYTSYYFGDKKTSTMQKGKIKVTEGDGDEETYYFSDRCV